MGGISCRVSFLDVYTIFDSFIPQKLGQEHHRDPLFRECVTIHLPIHRFLLFLLLNP